ncbi:hypothetical protein ACFPK9_13605 [Rubritalea spongiae]|uniref:Uncharacterized protein n=1 Tax=Rubritalea spongiae TaxID=430797 RepID=A0ABW5E2T9_9BACT
MDKQQAKFLLRSFRPDGEDAHMPEFADALRLATEDREVGEWLAQERATDAAFAKALNEVPIPDGLRDEILAVLEYDGQVEEVDTELDSLLAAGMAMISPPEGLREQILTAMEMEQSSVSEESNVTDVGMWRWLSVAGAAAVVAVGTFLTINKPEQNTQAPAIVVNTPATSSVIDSNAVRPVSVHNAVQEMADKLVDPEGIDLNTNLSCEHAAKDFLTDKHSPVPSTLPQGLKDAKLVGARDMLLQSGQPVSLLCFEKEGMGMVHIMVVESKHLEDPDVLDSMKSVSLKSCFGCDKTHFNTVHWKEGETAYVMLTKANKQDMVNLF